jgi:hypothetical protein
MQKISMFLLVVSLNSISYVWNMKRSHEQFDNPYMIVMGVSVKDEICMNGLYIEPRPLKPVLAMFSKETVQDDSFIIKNTLLDEIDKEIKSLNSDQEEEKSVEAIVMSLNTSHAYKCSHIDCRYSTNHHNRINTHERVHAALKNSKEKGFKCETCHYRALKKCAFETHEKTHASQRYTYRR